MSKKSILALSIILGVLAIDQGIKIYIKLNYPLGIVKEFSDWAYLYFTENPGMAFGIEWGGKYGKLLLTLFRIFACGFGIWYIKHLIKKGESSLFIASISLVLAGAIGNILDSVFYGMFFTQSTDYEIAKFTVGNGYESVLHGKVVDMFYFPMFSGTFPKWLPIWGGEDFLFFRPIFNLADASITVGVFILLLFQKKIQAHSFKISNTDSDSLSKHSDS